MLTGSSFRNSLEYFYKIIMIGYFWELRCKIAPVSMHSKRQIGDRPIVIEAITYHSDFLNRWWFIDQQS